MRTTSGEPSRTLPLSMSTMRKSRGTKGSCGGLPLEVARQGHLWLGRQSPTTDSNLSSGWAFRLSNAILVRPAIGESPRWIARLAHRSSGDPGGVQWAPSVRGRWLPVRAGSNRGISGQKPRSVGCIPQRERAFLRARAKSFSAEVALGVPGKGPVEFCQLPIFGFREPRRRSCHANGDRGQVGRVVDQARPSHEALRGFPRLPHAVHAADIIVGASESPTQFGSPGGFLQPMCVSSLSDFGTGRQS